VLGVEPAEWMIVSSEVALGNVELAPALKSISPCAADQRAEPGAGDDRVVARAADEQVIPVTRLHGARLVSGPHGGYCRYRA